MESLIKKYNIQAPRYTSYPTLPFWEKSKMPETDWAKSIKRAFKETNLNQGISLYIHLPYCESLCTYCACSTRITKNHSVEDDYIDTLILEWKMYLELFQEKPTIREIHFGGGTPTFFSPSNLKRLMEGLLNTSRLHSDYCFSFEGHPNNTSWEHLKTLYDLGFRRVSFGIQDFETKVQEAINRVQPYSNVRRVTEDAREIGYTSINFDLIYGLPFQTIDSIRDTFKKTIDLRPDRIAYYSYAHVPWKHKSQRAYDEADLPTNQDKRMLYEVGNLTLLSSGYHDIGMDHFGLKGDELVEAFRCKTLHRNFMGYTTNPTSLLIGLGASAISDARYAYAQNEKDVDKYKNIVKSGQIPLTKGHLLTDQDLEVRTFINNILCKGEVTWTKEPNFFSIDTLIELHTMADEGLIQFFENGFRVLDGGMPFIRNICMLFDQYMNTGHKDNNNQFSMSI